MVTYLMQEFNVLVLPDKVEEKSKGGIIIADMARDHSQHQATLGTLIAISPLAFTFENYPAGARTPKVGDRVLFAKYAGSLVDINKPDGLRTCKDKDILAVIEEDTPGPGYNHESDWPGTRK